jgi:hypothetical protein
MAKLIIKTRYANTPNNLLNNKNLSLSAKGLYGYLQSKPDNWDFSIAGMASQCKEGEKAIRTAIKELEIEGWLIRYNYQGEGGKWTCEYELQDTQLSENQRKILKPYSPHGDTVKGVPLVGIPATGTQSKPYYSKKEKNIYIDNFSNSSTKTNNQVKESKPSKTKTNKHQTTIEKYENEIPEIIAQWNQEFKTRKISKCSTWLKNYCLWREPKKITENIIEEGFTVEEIKKAISSIWLDSYWCNIMTPEIFFRHSNIKTGEDVNYIQKMLDKAQEEVYNHPPVYQTETFNEPKIIEDESINQNIKQDVEIEFTAEEQIIADQLMNLSTEDFIKARLASKK